MTGVEILATQEAAIASTFNMSAFWTTASIVFGVFLVIGLFESVVDCDWSGFMMFVVAGIIAGCLFGAIVGHAESSPTEYETRYKVTISDVVPMNDFLEKYEIISQEGKIYTVRERND